MNLLVKFEADPTGGGLNPLTQPPPSEKEIMILFRTGDILRDKQCTICLGLREKAFEIKFLRDRPHPWPLTVKSSFVKI